MQIEKIVKEDEKKDVEAQKKTSIIGMNSLLNRENYLLIVSLKEMETIKNTTHIDNFC